MIDRPLLILAADHRPRGVMTIEPYAEYLAALGAALPHCDGVLATAQPLGDLRSLGLLTESQRTYLSINRTGLAGSVFELDDRLVATVERARRDGWTGIKHMTRIDMSDAATAPALELLGQVLEQAHQAEVEAMIEVLAWRDRGIDRSLDAVIRAAVIAHDMGAPLLKLSVPDAAPGPARADAVARVVASVGVPVLFLGGPVRDRAAVLAEVQDVMDGGASGVAIGRTVLQDPDPAEMAALMAAIVRH